MTKICYICGELFEAKSGNEKYCSAACRVIASRTYGNHDRRKRAATNMTNISDVNREAMKAGVSYGKYVESLRRSHA